MSGIQYCKSFLLEQLQGVHDFSSDTIKIALFDGSASFDDDTTAYSTSNEISDSGYTAGGATLALSTGYPQIESGMGAVRFDAPSWTLAGSVAVRWALIYNATESNKAILSIDLFGQAKTLSGPLTVTFPTNMAPIINNRAPNIS